MDGRSDWDGCMILPSPVMRLEGGKKWCLHTEHPSISIIKPAQGLMKELTSVVV
jgi:hypothetical protein